MSPLKRRIVEQEDGKHWALYGQHGVISWGQLKGTRQTIDGPIGIHSPRPLYASSDDEPSNDCPFIEGACYVDAGYIAGDRLGKAWRAVGCDDEVIWRELEQWYVAHLVDGAS